MPRANSSSERPLDPGSLRPFRLWDALAKRLVPWRHYAYHDKAIEGAWRELQWPGFPPQVEVYDITNGKHIATLTRKKSGEYTRWVHKDWNYRRPA